jgi:flagellar biosynthesis/type III secretory pathway chaperone
MQDLPLIQLLDTLLKLHKSLNELADEKTEVIKKNDVEKLNQLILIENKHIKEIQKVERERVEYMSTLFPKQPLISLNECISQFSELDQEKIQARQKDLSVEINKLKTANNLNQSLLEQSLSYINLNLDLIYPQVVNTYGKENLEENQTIGDIRLFDSKA